MSKSNPPFMSGVPELLVLRLLSSSEMYGYELVKSIQLATNEKITLGEGVVYPTLHSLEKAGCLKSSRRPVNGRERVYYSTTSKGKKRLELLSDRWESIRGGIDSALQGPVHEH